MTTRNPAFVGYRKGAPMAGNLPASPNDAMAPSFMAYALRDPIGANLVHTTELSMRAGAYCSGVSSLASIGKRRRAKSGLEPNGAQGPFNMAAFRSTTFNFINYENTRFRRINRG